MRDVEKLHDELRLMSVVRSAIRSEGGRPSAEIVDRLLDELIEVTGGGDGEADGDVRRA